MNKQAFTLIELLVVVLIIGILAAVALPQYQKVVEKSKSAQALTMLKSVYQAADAYYMSNGEWPASFDELSVDIPWTGNEGILSGSSYPTKSNDDWALQLDHSGTKNLSIWRLKGKYKAAGFIIHKQNSTDPTIPLSQVLCIERANIGGATAKFALPNGAYCESIMKAKRLVGAIETYNLTYILP